MYPHSHQARGGTALNRYSAHPLRQPWLRFSVAIVELAIADGVPVTRKGFFYTELFENICAATGVDAEAARQRLKRKRAEIRQRVLSPRTR